MKTAFVQSHQDLSNLSNKENNLKVESNPFITDNSTKNPFVSGSSSNPFTPVQMKENPVQMQEEEEESMQMKKNPVQMQEEEEESLQMKKNPVQMQEEEEESMQMKKNPVQMQEEEEESMQMKKNPLQMQAMEEEEEEGMLQAKKEPSQLKSDPIQKQNLPSQGGGKSLPKQVKGQMENAFGADFSDVRIHQNSSNASNVGALAYTQGSDIHFAPGQYNPGSKSGQELLGHELEHVRQQRTGNVKATTQSNGVPVNDDPKLESQADQMGRKVSQMSKKKK